MSHHRMHDSEPQLVFSRDPHSNEFRESISGWFLRGHPLTINYDPTRIVPPDKPYRFGDPAQPIIAHLQFREGSPVQNLTLESWIGTPGFTPDTTAQRSPKLHGVVPIPEDADWVTIWISFHPTGGPVLYDSSFGRNFRFRFYQEELTVIQSDIIPNPASNLGTLKIQVSTDPCVQRVLVRYRILTDPIPATATQIGLHKVKTATPTAAAIWETPETLVPADRVVSYDLVYFADDRPFKDNNQGQSYLAVDPEKRLKHPV
jgi:hypothetical protein